MKLEVISLALQKHLINFLIEAFDGLILKKQGLIFKLQKMGHQVTYYKF